MPKHKSKNVQRAAKAAAQIATSPAMAAALPAIAASAEKAKKKKKGKSSFWNIVGGAAKMAADLAPVVAPLLLANHGPSLRAANANPGAASVAAAGVPLASATSCAACTGMYDLKPKKSADGRVSAVVVSGMDYLGDLDVDSEEIGTILSTKDLNPFSADWAGTMLQRQASLFERYRPRRVACMVESSCAATTAGQIISYIDPDPDDEMESTGRTAVQEASAHEGADVAQVWQTSCAGYAFDKNTQDFFADADGSDERLISPGKWRVLANTTMPAATTIGSLYVIWEYEFKVPQIDNDTTNEGAFVLLQSDTSTDSAALPMGASSWETMLGLSPVTQASFTGDYDTTTGKFNNIPQGLYLVGIIEFTGSAGLFTTTVDGTVFRDALNLTATTVSSAWNFSASATAASMYVYLIDVTARSDDPSHFIHFANSVVPQAAGTRLFFAQIPRSLFFGLSRKKTLQDFERESAIQTQRLADLEGLVHSLMSTLQVPGPLSSAALATRRHP